MYLLVTSHCMIIFSIHHYYSTSSLNVSKVAKLTMIYYSILHGNKEHVASALIKWFNTNYHYIVPEWDNVEPKVNHNILLDFNYAKSLNVNAHPVIVGPITFVKLSKGGHQSFEEKFKHYYLYIKKCFNH